MQILKKILLDTTLNINNFLFKILILFFSYSKLFAENELKFLEWKKNFKDLAIKNDISDKKELLSIGS